MKQREKKAIETKERIIESARELLLEKEYQKIGIRDICERANVSTGAFYHHFSSKDDIISYGFNLFNQELGGILTECEAKEPEEAVRYIISCRMNFIERYMKGLIKEILVLELSQGIKIPEDYNSLLHNALEYYLSQILKNQEYAGGKSTEEITDLLLRLVNGNVLDWCFKRYSFSLTDQMNDDIGMFFHYLSAK